MCSTADMAMILSTMMQILPMITVTEPTVPVLLLSLIHIDVYKRQIMDTIAQAVSSVYVKAQEKNIEIEVVKNSDEAADMAIPHDPHWTREAIANILENAVKYSGRDTCIQIRMMKRTSFLRIEIEDQGIGIDSRDYTKIFQRFYRGTCLLYTSRCV